MVSNYDFETKMKVLLLVGVLSLLVTTVLSQRDPLCNEVPPGSIYLYPVPGDCTEYYKCDESGVRTLETCPDGLFFNEALQACDHPENTNCVGLVCPPGIVDFFPNPYDCAKYVECYQGRAESHTCPDQLWFNAKEKRCTNPDQSNCGEYATTLSPTWTTPTADCWGVPPNHTELRPYQGDCNKFIECIGSQETIMACPPQFNFAPDRQMCDWPDITECDYSTGTPNPSTLEPPTTPSGDDDPRCANGNNDYWPDEDYCNLFIECYQGHAYSLACPSGLYFDPITKRCVDPSASSCGRTTLTPDPDTTTRGSDWTPDPDCQYATGDRYLFPYPGDCTKYLNCYTGIKVVENCPPNLWFNPKLMVCDYPAQAGCTQVAKTGSQLF